MNSKLITEYIAFKKIPYRKNDISHDSLFIQLPISAQKKILFKNKFFTLSLLRLILT